MGFLHDFADYQTKQSLVYDLQEPFRWICDVATIQAFESWLLDTKDFYFMGDDYRYHLDVVAKRRFLQLLKDRFNSGVKYKGKKRQWDTIIEQKASELGRFLVGKSFALDFAEPGATLQRQDTRVLRDRILALTPSMAREFGIGKSTIHYLHSNAKNDQPFRCYHKVLTRLSATSD